MYAKIKKDDTCQGGFQPKASKLNNKQHNLGFRLPLRLTEIARREMSGMLKEPLEEGLEDGYNPYAQEIPRDSP